VRFFGGALGLGALVAGTVAGTVGGIRSACKTRFAATHPSILLYIGGACWSYGLHYFIKTVSKHDE
jgi:hypothetical protein